MVTDAQLVLLRRKIKRERGIDINYYKESFIRRRIQNRLHQKNIKFREYLNLFNKEECKTFLKGLSINVTEFFRDKEMWDLFQNLILPNLVFYKEGLNRKTIRVWCAGCASGEEAYTVAIILKEFFQDKNDFQININATDIDNFALERAKIGIYTKDRVKNVKKDLLEKYFFTDGTWYEVDDEIKKLVRFTKQDIIHDEPQRHFDIIFCRNVFIYFSKELQDELFENLHSGLNKFGFLILGKTEGLIGNQSGYFTTVDLSERIYRKLI